MYSYICLSVDLHVFIYLSVCRSTCIHISVCLSIYLSTLSIYLRYHCRATKTWLKTKVGTPDGSRMACPQNDFSSDCYGDAFWLAQAVDHDPPPSLQGGGGGGGGGFNRISIRSWYEVDPTLPARSRPHPPYYIFQWVKPDSLATE